MQWLNKLDGILDSVLLPRGNRSSRSEEGQLLHDSSSFDAEEYYVYTGTADRHPNEGTSCDQDSGNGLDHDTQGEEKYQNLVPIQEDVRNNNNSSSSGSSSGIHENHNVQGKQQSREESTSSEWKRGVKEDTGGWTVQQPTTTTTGTVATGRGGGSIVSIQNSDRQNTATAPIFPRPGMIRPVLREHCSDDDSSFSQYETDDDGNDDECDDDDNYDDLHSNSHHGEGLVALSTPKEIHTTMTTTTATTTTTTTTTTSCKFDLTQESPARQLTFEKNLVPIPPPPKQAFERVIPPPKMAFPKAISSSPPFANANHESDKEPNTLIHYDDALIVENKNENNIHNDQHERLLKKDGNDNNNDDEGDDKRDDNLIDHGMRNIQQQQQQDENPNNDALLLHAVSSLDISRGSHDCNIDDDEEEEEEEKELFQGDNQERKDKCCSQNHQPEHQPQSPSHSDTERIQEPMDSNLLSIQNNNMDTTSPCLSMDTLQEAQTADTHEYDDGYDGIEQMQATFGDFLPGATFQDDSSEDGDMSTSTSMTQREGEDYMLEGPISWEEEEDMVDGAVQCTQPFEPDMNCHGIVHVRLLRVQHLPCSKGSSLQATFSLPPWKGRIRTDKVVTYRGPSNAGICARWDMGSAADKKDHVGDSKELLDADFELRSGDDDNGDHKEKPKLSYISMVHAYNNEETPVPTISIELKDMALMFERNVCFLNISCVPLMRQPGVFRKRWCPAKREHGGSTETKKGQRKIEDCTDQSKTPLFLIEACFEPTDFGDSKSLGEMPVEDLDTITFSKSLEDGKENQENYQELQGSPQRKKNVTKKRLKSNPHMFRNYSALRPTYCAICNTVIAWKFKGYQCEVCKLDCCADCQLRVDVEMPCGSEKALDAVKKMSESKLTLSKIYEVIAPKKVNDEMSNDRQFPIDASENEAQKRWKDGVGTLTLHIKKACLFRHNFPPEADLDYILEVSDRWLRSGDYYARVSWTDGTDTKRTKTVFQTAKPRFDSDDIVIISSHYGTEFRIEVVDATTDMAIGTKLLTTQGLLQWQRDNNGWGLSASSLMNEEPISLQKLGACMELRANVKTGFGIDFYNSSRISENAKAGEISGWIELDVMFRENPDLYSFSNPRPCPPRPTDDFNVELIQLHIARITAIVEDIWSFIDEVSYIISWKNPALTSLSLLIFITACLRLNSEYIGSFPFAVVIIIMLHTGRMRKTGASFRVRLLKKETEAKVKEMKGNMVKYKKHRPVAELDIAVLRGRNLAPNHRIPGSLVASIFWEPSKFADEYTKRTIKDIDPSSCGLHQIGETEGSGMTSSPEWLIAHPSNELERMKQLLPSKNFLSRTNSSADLKIDILKEIKPLDTSTLTFPILQSISAPSIIPEADLEEEEETEEDNNNLAGLPSENIQLVPWESSKGAIVIQVRFADVLNKLPIFDQVLGEVVIPLARLAKDGSIEGWFKVLEKGTIRTEEDICDEETRKVPCSNKDASDILNRLVGGDSEQRVSVTTPEDASKHPSIFLQARLKVPSTSDTTDIDKETSRVIAEHLIRSTKAKEDSGLGFLGTSISTFNTVTGVRGNVQNIQNQLGSALDMIEIFKNLFNFTCPEKSGIILIATTVLWFVLVFIPTRYIILLGGLAQYTATFKAAFAKNERNTHDIRRADSEEKDNYDPILTRLTNFFISVPTNEDLRRYYFWEAVKVGEVEREILANKKRATRLTKLWKAQWFGKLELKVKTSISMPSERKWEWKTIFCIIQGHRFIWWESERDFDEGENPSGQIYFAGHSGLAGLSPLELRELKPDEVPLVVNIFGRGASRGGEQTKISLLTQDTQTKHRFEASVLNAVLDKND